MSKRSAFPEAPRRNGPRQVAELLPQVGGAAFRRFGFVQSSLVSRWGEIVGEKWAQVSAPESLRFPRGKKAEGVLTVTVSGAHAAMIQHILPEIAERANRFFGYTAVARIVIRQGDVVRREARRQAPPSVRPAPVALGAGLKTIADPELKAVLEALAAGVAASRGPPLVGER